MKCGSLRSTILFFLLLAWTVSTSVPSSAIAQYHTGMRPGDWVTYRVNGAFGAGKATVQITGISDAIVTGTFQGNISGITHSPTIPTQFSINVETYTFSGVDLRSFFIPASMNVSDTLPGPAALVLQGPVSRYGRQALYVEYEVLGLHSKAYYDTETGVLLEMSETGLVEGSLTLAENSYGWSAGGAWTYAFWAVAGVVGIAILYVVVRRIRHRK